MMKFLCIVGTRPEAIKMAPIILALKKVSWAKTLVLATAQHREMLDQVLAVFDITLDEDLDIMRPDQTLPELTARLITHLDVYLEQSQPDVVLAQGDTSTVLVAALACFYRHIPFGHVEAGLRTRDLNNPFPEEMNRVLTSRLARWHFCPTKQSVDNLCQEGVPAEALHLTGNTVIDALLMMADKKLPVTIPLNPNKKTILVTAHRRESFGQPIKNICQAVRMLATHREDLQFIFPVHPNRNIAQVVRRTLTSLANVHLTSPLEYPSFVAAMQASDIILTDSGGVQEEAPALGKPVLVLRAETERPEAIKAGVAILVGTDQDGIITETERLLDDPIAYSQRARCVFPYGDGKATDRILSVLQDALCESC